MASPGALKLKTSDNLIFEVEAGTAVLSPILKDIIDKGDSDESVLPLPKITGSVLAKVIDWCTEHVKDGADGRRLKEFDKRFIQMETKDLFEIIQAANYLEITDLLSLSCQGVADMIKGKSPEEIREFFDITL